MKRVLEIFEEICAIPHGSGNMEAISDYCLAFAEKCGLEAWRDEGMNVVIRKNAACGFEKADGVLLQGHLDMVCQKDDGIEIDFEKDGVQPYRDGDFLKAKGTTLGADNGIAVAMILAVLERSDLAHPFLEAVFTTDEEIGMVGAKKLDVTKLRGRKMINLDSEEDDTLTVSCAGGCEVAFSIPLKRKRVKGEKVKLVLKGLQGGHSGVEIHKGRINADLLAGRVLNQLGKTQKFSLVSVNGGDKDNAIPKKCEICLLAEDGGSFFAESSRLLEEIRSEIKCREPNFSFSVTLEGKGEADGIEASLAQRICSALNTVPNGVLTMSAEIQGLVETSLNLGVLKTEEHQMLWRFALRSNKASALGALEDQMFAFARLLGCKASSDGHYPPWEYRAESSLRDTYRRLYREVTGQDVKVEAIHAGLECAVFAAALPDLDCIAIGPSLFDVHTTREKMSLSSVEKIYDLVTRLLKESR